MLCLGAALLCGCGRSQKEQGAQKTEGAPAAGNEADQNGTDKNASEKPGEADKAAVCNNAASLLQDLLGQEKDVGKILLIKKKAPAFEKLVKEISKTAGDGEKRLDQLAKDNPALDLHQMRLPAGEVATREAQSKEQEHTLLGAKDETFEFDLLLTQAQALDYGSHLAGVAAGSCAVPAEADEFKMLQTDLGDLYTRSLAQMRALPRVAERRERESKKKRKS